MDYRTASPTSSYSSTATATNPNSKTTAAQSDPMHAWWESISKARTRIHALAAPLPSLTLLSSLAESDHPARSLLLSSDVYAAISESLSSPSSGSGSDLVCQWLYETFQISDPDLRLIVYSYIPLISGLYMCRVVSKSSEKSLAGFEAVLLAVYGLEVKNRAGKPVLVTVPDLSQPSLYHTPKEKAVSGGVGGGRSEVGVVCGALEPQNAVKSTKRAAIVGVALDCYFKVVAQMPSWSKVEFCAYVGAWSGQHCECRTEFDKEDEEHEEVFDRFSEIRISVEGRDDEDENVVKEKVAENGNGSSASVSKGARIPMPWELLQPALRILGHCLLGPLNPQDVKDAASVAVRAVYARASHDLVPQGLLATRSLIQLDKRARKAAGEVLSGASVSNVNTPTKAKKPEMLLVSK